MPSSYKPSQWRGKRVIFLAADPSAQGNETAKVFILIFIVSIGIALVAWLTY